MIEVPLTPQEFAALGQKLEADQGITLTGDTGNITKMGVTAAYAYQDGLLTINILEKPFFVTTDYCEEQLRGFFHTKS